MGQLFFYIQYAARSLWRSRRWSAFAVFSVAAGVATVVALRSLGLAIGDSLTSNVRASNHGDITLSRNEMGVFYVSDPAKTEGFTAIQVDLLRQWVDEQHGAMTAYVESGNVQIIAHGFSTIGRPQFISTFFIDPATYPPTDDIRALDPAGVRLGDLFQGGNEVVISENLAQAQNISVGDPVRVSGTEDEFIVRGIVSTAAEAGMHNIFASFFGFAYFDIALAGELPVSSNPNTISLTLPDGTSAQDIKAAADTVGKLLGRDRGGILIVTAPDRLADNQQIADVLGSFIVILGLGALLIGGVGIINTMLVMVRRRTEEIAALKTFGLKGRQVAALFMAEAVLLGIAGSVIGSVLGVLLSTVANAYGSTLIQQPLTWRFHPEAVGFGLTLGMVVTVVFGVLPVLTAAKVRPAIILRPNETHVPRTGVLQSLIAILLVVVVIGFIAGRIMAAPYQMASGNFAMTGLSLPSDPTLVGIIGVAVTLLILGILVGLLWLVVWLVGKLPAFGLVDFRMAQRNLSTRRIRTATTLLALSAGMFALSSIAFFGEGAREILQYSLNEALGGNVIVFTVLPSIVSQPLIDNRLNQVEGITYQTHLANYSGQIQAINNVMLDSEGLNPVEIRRQLRAAQDAGDTVRADELYQQMLIYWETYVMLMSRDTDNPNLEEGSVIAGRNLTPDDQGQRVAVVRQSPLLIEKGLGVGSTITVEINNRPYDFQVVGIQPEFNFQDFQSNITFGNVQIPVNALNIPATFQFTVLQIEPEHINDVLLSLSSIPLVYALDIGFIDGVMRRLLDQMSAIPILVGLLSLGAAAVIMANTVALATLERRRQIGILKALGLKGRRVMRIMLLENTIVCLLGALLGLGMSAIGVWVMTYFGLEIAILIPAEATSTAVALVAAAMFIGWLATFLSANVAVHERVLNVLRYE